MRIIAFVQQQIFHSEEERERECVFEVWIEKIMQEKIVLNVSFDNKRFDYTRFACVEARAELENFP